MKTFSPAIGKKAMTVFQEAYPTNPKAMYFLGMPNFVESAFNIMKGFMKDKMKGRLHVRLFCSILQSFTIFIISLKKLIEILLIFFSKLILPIKIAKLQIF